MKNATSSNYRNWFSPALNIYSCYKRFDNPLDYDSFELLRARCKKLIKKCHEVYITSVQDSIKIDDKNFWRYANRKKGTSSIPLTMKYNNTVSSSVGSVCEMFSRHFSSVFEHPSDSHNFT